MIDKQLPMQIKTTVNTNRNEVQQLRVGNQSRLAGGNYLPTAANNKKRACACIELMEVIEDGQRTPN